MSDEKHPIEEKETAEDEPLTKEQFEAQMQRLTERARAAGLSPLRVLGQTYAKRGMAIMDAMLGALEDDDNSKKKKE